MNTYDETIYQAQTDQDGNENETQYQKVTEETSEQKALKSEKSSNGWVKVAVGGVTGVLMGAAGMYVGKPYLDDAVVEGRSALADWMEANGMEELAEKVRPADKSQASKDTTPEPEPVPEPDSEPIPFPTPEDTAEPIHVARVEHHVSVPPIEGPLQVAHVDQSLSFADAYAHAREEVGPGGLFQWHDGVFNTYTVEEWDSMSAADRSVFAHYAAPTIQETLISPTGGDEPDIALAGNEDEIIDVTLVNEDEASGDEESIVLENKDDFTDSPIDMPTDYMDDPSADLGTMAGMDDMVVDDPGII